MKIKYRKILFGVFCISVMNCCAFSQTTMQIENLQEQSNTIDTHLENRAKVIKYCMDTFSTPINMESGNEQKIMAAYEEQRKALLTLGKLRAAQAAPLLAGMITYNIPGNESSNPSFVNRMFGCVPTLVKIGKPGAVECLKRIINYTEKDWENDMDVTLLVLVIIRVEGEKSTRQIFDNFKSSLKDETQIKNIERAAPFIDAARDLDGVVMDAYSKLKQELIEAGQ